MKTLGKILTGIVIVASSLLPMNKAEAQDNNVKASVDMVQSEKEPVSFIRPNLFYKFLGLNNYSFFEFYRNEDFFGKTILSKDLGKGMKATGELVYGSGFSDSYGAGASVNIPMPEGTSLSVKALPLWFNKSGYIDDKVQVGFFGKVNLPLGFNLSSFGEMNVVSKKGPQWGYGEISLSKNLLDNLTLSYNPLLKNQGKLQPRLEHAVRVNYTF